MPAIPTPVLIFKVVCQTVEGQFTNISYWEPTASVGTSGFLQLMVNDFNNNIKPLYRAFLNGSNRYLGVSGTYKNGITLLQAGKTDPGAGLAPNSPVSDQNAVVIRKHTNTTGRQNRGRFFIGGMDTGSFDPAAPDEVEAVTALPLYQALASFYGSDQTLNGMIVHARHWDRLDNLLKVITECKVASRVASRDDRRRHASNVDL